MPASERIAGTKKDVKIVVDVLPIEPKGLALYYDAIRGYTSKRDDSHGWHTSRQLAFNSMANIGVAEYSRLKSEEFTSYIPWSYPVVIKSSTYKHEELRDQFESRRANIIKEYRQWGKNSPYIPSPWSDWWDTYAWDVELKQLWNEYLDAKKLIKYTVSQNYFEVLHEIRDRVQWMIDECGAEICQGLATLLPAIDAVLEIWANQEWNINESAYLSFDIQHAIDLADTYDKVIKNEKKRLEEISQVKDYNNALNERNSVFFELKAVVS